MWKICDSTSYLYGFDIYTGKVNTQKSKNGLGYDVVMHLTSLLPENRKFQIFTDNFYTSVALVEALLDKNIYLTGTCKVTSKNFPTAVAESEIPNLGDMVYRMKDT